MGLLGLSWAFLGLPWALVGPFWGCAWTLLGLGGGCSWAVPGRCWAAFFGTPGSIGDPSAAHVRIRSSAYHNSVQVSVFGSSWPNFKSQILIFSNPPIARVLHARFKRPRTPPCLRKESGQQSHQTLYARIKFNPKRKRRRSLFLGFGGMRVSIKSAAPLAGARRMRSIPQTSSLTEFGEPPTLPTAPHAADRHHPDRPVRPQTSWLCFGTDLRAHLGDSESARNLASVPRAPNISPRRPETVPTRPQHRPHGPQAGPQMSPDRPPNGRQLSLKCDQLFFSQKY
jgi:hypothetical protein